MVETILLKLATVTLAIGCFVFGGWTVKKSFKAIREQSIDDKIDGSAAEHLGLESLGLSAFVFLFGFGLLYFLTRF